MPVEELPLTLENLRRILGEPTMELADCPICREMPEYCTRFVKGGDVQNDDIPEAAAKIEPFLTFGEHIRTPWIGRCPTCHRAYLCTEEYEFIYGGSEDSSSYRRITADKILALPEAKRHTDPVLRGKTRWRIEPRAAPSKQSNDDDDVSEPMTFTIWDP